MTPGPLIVADGDFPTTRLVALELRVVHPKVEVRVPETLFGAEFRGRPIVVSRLCRPMLSWLPEYLSQRRLRYAYLLDDNFWELPPDMDEFVAPYYNHPAVLDTLGRFVRGATVVIVWSARLREYIAERYPDVRVEWVPAGIDLARLDALRLQPQPSHERFIRIGYPTTRRPGVSALLEALVRKAGARYAERVQFDFVGWMPESLEGMPNVTFTPHITDYERYLQFVLSRRWDVGLAPLIGSPFESYKTDVKYREYTGFGVPGIYSRVSPYTEAIADGRNGLLVDNDPEAWFAALEQLIEAARMRSAIVEAARADILQHRDLRTTGARFSALLPPNAKSIGSR